MAFVRIGYFRAQPDKIEELRSVYEREVLPSQRSAPGNVSACLLQEHGDPARFMACTGWRTAEDAVAYDQSGQAAAMVGKIRHTFAGPPELVTCEGIGI
jgi:quinol monooxygenase YgiN